MRRLIAIIPAKLHSRRLPFKNLRGFLGRPLLWYPIQCALHSQSIGRVIVTTESPVVAKIAKSLGAQTPFLRPRKLANSGTPMVEVIAHAFRRLPDEESLIILQPTSPLRLPQDIDASVKLFLSGEDEEVVSVSPVKAPGGIFSPERDLHLRLARHSASDTQFFALNGAIYIVPNSRVKTGALLGKRIIGYPMPPERSIDIDTESDLKLAEIMAKGLALDEIFNQWERDR